ncbi:MAG: DUF1801 domain-containing protein [Bacteroidota bacterium]
MKIEANTPDEYIEQLPEDRKLAISKLRQEIKSNIPDGFEEEMSYNMIGYVVPHSIYPSGYHCDPKLPLPFINLASQKNHVAVYHSGIYTYQQLMDWFIFEFEKLDLGKLDMGKSCIRFKKMDKIPFELIGELASKMSVEQWIELYESAVKNSRKKA